MNIDFPPLYGSDLVSAALVTAAYFALDDMEDVLCSGFNTSSGYVYIALENGVTIASCFGQSVDYIVSDPDTGEEKFYDSYPAR
jgi:hypothetical protein